MNIIAYTYEADTHCIDCTNKRFGATPTYRIHRDNEGNLIDVVLSIDEWQELDEGFLAENPTQYLVCGDCHEIIDTYTIAREVTTGM